MNEIITDVYLKGLTEFTEETVILNDSKILQMTYDRKGNWLRSFILTSYKKEAKRLIKLKRPTIEEKKQMLLEYVLRFREKYPMEFNKVGWWDREVAVERGTP